MSDLSEAVERLARLASANYGPDEPAWITDLRALIEAYRRLESARRSKAGEG